MASRTWAGESNEIETFLAEVKGRNVGKRGLNKGSSSSSEYTEKFSSSDDCSNE